MIRIPSAINLCAGDAFTFASGGGRVGAGSSNVAGEFGIPERFRQPAIRRVSGNGTITFSRQSPVAAGEGGRLYCDDTNFTPLLGLLRIHLSRIDGNRIVIDSRAIEKSIWFISGTNVAKSDTDLRKFFLVIRKSSFAVGACFMKQTV